MERISGGVRDKDEAGNGPGHGEARAMRKAESQSHYTVLYDMMRGQISFKGFTVLYLNVL